MKKIWLHKFWPRWSWQQWVLVVLALCLSLGQLLRIPLTTTIAVTGSDIVVAIFVVISLIKNQQPSFSVSTWSPLQKQAAVGWLVALMLGWSGAIATHQWTLLSLLYTVRLGITGLFLLCLYQQSDTALPAHWLLRLLQLIGLSWCWFGFLQFALLPDTRFLSILGWDDHYYRLIGTILDPNYLGLLLVSTFWLWWYYPLKTWPWLNRVIIAGLGLAVVLTFSRISYLALAVSSLWVGWQRLRKQYYKRALTLAAVCLAVGLITWGITTIVPRGEGSNLLRTASIQARITADTQQLATLNSWQWLVGRGVLTPTGVKTQLGLPQHARFANNLIVFCITQMGLLGTLLFLFLIGHPLKTALQQSPVIAIVLTIFIGSQTNAVLTMQLLLLFVGMVIVVLERKKYE